MTGQTQAQDVHVRYDGFYIAKSKEIKAGSNTIEFFRYLVFYEDGTVYSATVTSIAPESVAKWFGKTGGFEQDGTFKIDGGAIEFATNNDNSTDKKLEGAKTTSYKGSIVCAEELSLSMEYSSGETLPMNFKFYPAEITK